MNRIILPLCPSMNTYWRNFKGITVLSKEAKDFKLTTASIARQEGIYAPLQGEVKVEITYHPKARKKETNKPMRRRDIDNCIKPTLDALESIAYLDDNQVVDVRATLGAPVEDGQLVVFWDAA